MTMQTWEVLSAAADKIERDGWTNYGGSLMRGEPCCVSNAICVVSEHVVGAQNALIRAIGTDSIEGIFAWNDAPERTAAEVIAMLRAVAASEKARAQQTEPAHESVPV